MEDFKYRERTVDYSTLTGNGDIGREALRASSLDTSRSPPSTSSTSLRSNKGNGIIFFYKDIISIRFMFHGNKYEMKAFVNWG